MFITKKEFERRVNEAIERVHYERSLNDHLYRIDERIDKESHNLWEQIRLLTRRLDKIEGRDDEGDELKTVINCERL